ncbi:filamentous hemagglutinin outer membrane protein [Tolypothrix tenuis PCC 7101]|uniref:Filamentous hemagglutinin outer membrane protein n=2 Tax=Tolypothrix TaxID=111782 RepID=A0A1Z4MRW0_9CYAN|nr:filamentous hemagglutinin outer membrane protein [Tolypothrix tenuis PCC 7101]BAZ73268.1 filamentous hemagglutinin outer membrane protein [Aulosira laxa NIES-50]
MLQRNISKVQMLKLLSHLAIAGTFVIFEDPTFAQVTPDNTLGVEKSIVTSNTNNDSLRLQIEGGAIRGTNLFHSFSDFNIAEGQSLYFQNPSGITNIINRVTGGSSSSIEGTLGVSGGTANLFLLNPNGIIFGENSRLDVKGSFVATTATAIQFGNQGFFSSSTPDSPPLLTVNPSAFLFNQVAAAPIVNRSTTPLEESVRRGLKVPDSKSLLLLGGEINFAGGGVNAAGGQVDLGAVAGTGTVELSLDENRLRLTFPATLNRADISLTNGATVNTSGEGGGSIQIWGRSVFMNGGSKVAAFTQGAKSGSSLTVNASESLEVRGIVPYGNITTLSFGDGKAGDLMIETRRLSIRDGAQIISGTLGNGSAGQLTVNASESVEVAGRDSSTGSSSFLASFTGNAGQAGNLTVNTRSLIVRDGGALSTESLIASDDRKAFPRDGDSGNLTINASDSVELSKEGFIFTNTGNPRKAGNLTINTGRLLVQDGSVIGAPGTGLGKAGNITVRARSIVLSNQSQIDATNVSQGGNIILKVGDILLLRENSSISTNAGTAQAGGDGGNITFDGKFIVAIPNENSDISANAFAGNGGNIQINAQGIFGIESRGKPTDKSDITASSEQGISGAINLNQPDNSSIQNSFSQLLPNVIDTNALIANSCIARGSKRQENSFTITGSGALRNSPGDALISTYSTGDVRGVESTSRPWKKGEPIIEPQGLYRLPDGQLLLSRACS